MYIFALPIISDDRQRLLAAEAYFAAKSAGANKAERRKAALHAVGISIEYFRHARARAAAEKRAAAETAANEQREKAAAQFAREVEAATAEQLDACIEGTNAEGRGQIGGYRART